MLTTGGGYERRQARVNRFIGFVAALVVVFCLSNMPGANPADLKQSSKVLEILDSIKFRFTKQVSEVPETILAQAGVIKVDEQLDALMTDKPGRFADGDIVFPGTVLLLLNFCGISDRYLVLCYLHGGYASGCGLLLIGGLDTSPKTVLFQAELFCECQTLDEVKAVLRRGQFQVLQTHRIGRQGP